MKDTAWKPIVFSRVYRGHVITVARFGRRSWTACTPFDNFVSPTFWRTKEQAQIAARRRVRMNAPKPAIVRLPPNLTASQSTPKEPTNAR